MKTLADLKRRLVVGTVLELTHHRVPKAQAMVGVKRSIVQTTAKEIALEPSAATGGQPSWLTIPKAADLRIDGDAAFTILMAGERVMSYSIHPADG